MMTHKPKRRRAQGFGLGAVAAALLAVACATPGPRELQAADVSVLGVSDAGLPEAEAGPSPERSGVSPAPETISGLLVSESMTGNEVGSGAPSAPVARDTPTIRIMGPCDRPLFYVNGILSSRAQVDRLQPTAIEHINVFKGLSSSEAYQAIAEGRDDPLTDVGDPSCGMVSLLTHDATPAARQRVEALHKRISDAQQTQQALETVRQRVREFGARADEAARDTPQLQDAPTFTPMTVRPDLKNSREVREAIGRLYPPLIRDAGIGGTALVWLFIDEQGEVRRALINRSSGRPELDEAALEVSRVMEFSPAMNRDEVVPVWVALPITFGERASRPPPPAEDSDISVKPTFTPMTVRPKLKNSEEVRTSLMAHYPPLLRDAGIGGTTAVWFFIDETGDVQEARVAESSGRQELDEAAVRVAQMMEFAPAMNRDDRVPVWIQLPISFEVQ